MLRVYEAQQKASTNTLRLLSDFSWYNLVLGFMHSQLRRYLLAEFDRVTVTPVTQNSFQIHFY